MLGSEHRELLEDGKLLLYTREGIFYARVYVGNRKYLHKSLKTSKLTSARKLALKYFYEIEFRQAESLPLQQKSFGDVIDEYIALRQRDYERSKLQPVTSATKQHTTIHMLRQIKRVAKFWREYCGNIAVDKIDNSVLSDYITWRKDYYHNKNAADIPKNAEVPPKNSATGNLVKSVFEKENGLEEAVFRRADHRFFTAGGSRYTGQGTVSATWLQ